MKYIEYLIYEQYYKSSNKNQEKVLVCKTMKGFLAFLSKKTKKAPRANGLRLLALKLVRLFDIAFFFNFRELCYEYLCTIYML